MKRIWILFWLTAISASLTAQIDQRAIDKLLAREQSEEAPALMVGVWQNGKLQYLHNSGLANLEQGTKATSQTPFHLSFLTQQFIEYAILKLVREGRLNRNTPVTQYLKWLSPVYQKIKISHLLNHSSGLPDYWALRVLAGWGYDDPMSTAQAIEMIGSFDQLNHEPGEKTLYVNTNPFLLRQVIEAISGQPIDQYLNDHIFTPLGMENAFVSQDHTALIRGKANEYLNDGEGWKATFGHNGDIGPTGVFASLDDVHLWLDHLAQLPKSDQEALWKTQNYQDNDYRYQKAFYNGYRGYLGTFGDGYQIVILSADYYLNSWNQAMAIMELLTPGQPDEKTTQHAKVSTKAISYDPNLYVGDYWDPKEFHSRSIRFENDTLYYTTPDGWRSVLEPIATNEFRMLQSAAGRKIWFDPSGLEPMMAVGYSQENAYRYYAYDAVAPTEKELKTLAGDYYLPSLKAIYTLFTQDGKLYAKHYRSPPLLLDPLDRDRFGNEDEWYFSMVSIQRDASGKVTGFRLDTPELTELIFHKIELPK